MAVQFKGDTGRGSYRHPGFIKDLGMAKESYDTYRALIYNNKAYEHNTFFRGEIAEIIAHKRELDSEEQGAIMKYLKNKYNITRVESR